MKKFLISNILLLNATAAYAQEEAGPEVTPFWQDTTFLLLIGGAVFLIILLIVKKILEKRAAGSMEGGEENYENSNL